MGILGGLFAGIYGATSGPKRPAAANNTPPINASSSDEADFIKCANSWPRPVRETHADIYAGSSSRSRRVPRRNNKWRLWRTGVDGLIDTLYLYLALGQLLPVESNIAQDGPYKTLLALWHDIEPQVALLYHCASEYELGT